MAVIASTSGGWLFYLDPRIGLFVAETSLIGHEPMWPGVLRWPSVVAILGIGVAMIRGHALLGTYVIVEAVLSLPSVLFFGVVLAANLSFTHGSSITELIIPVPIFVVFSLIPLVCAIRLSRLERHKS